MNFKRQRWSWVFRMAISVTEICGDIRQLFMFFLFAFEEIKIVNLALNIGISMHKYDYKPISNYMFWGYFLPSCLLLLDLKTDTANFHIFQFSTMNISRLYNVTEKGQTCSLSTQNLWPLATLSCPPAQAWTYFGLEKHFSF